MPSHTGLRAGKQFWYLEGERVKEVWVTSLRRSCCCRTEAVDPQTARDVALPLLPLALAIVKLLGWGWWRCCSSSEGVALVQRSHTDHRSLYFVSTIGFVSTSLRLWGWSAWMPYASLWLVREVGLAVGWVLV
eukprot:scaffold51422_cov71-Phaeocystis_antarctica.AAC.1